MAEFLNVEKRYGENVVLAGVNFLIERGDRIALIGPNGAGKSTLIRMLAGAEPLTGGEYRLGYNAEPDYFAQDQYKALDPGVRLIDDLASVAPSRTQTELRTLLGCFLFTGDEVFKTIGVLSGGERNRYALARLLLHPSNFLLLDEPTNHLDMHAKDVLLQALLDYTGTLVFVSHDRYFIDRLATKVFEVGGGRVQIYAGNYEDYLRAKNGAGALPPAVAADPQPAAPARAASVEAAPPRRINPIKLRQMQDRCRALEERIALLEKQIAESERELSVFESAERSAQLARQLAGQRAELDKLLEEWEGVLQSIEAAQTAPAP